MDGGFAAGGGGGEGCGGVWGRPDRPRVPLWRPFHTRGIVGSGTDGVDFVDPHQATHAASPFSLRVRRRRRRRRIQPSSPRRLCHRLPLHFAWCHIRLSGSRIRGGWGGEGEVERDAIVISQPRTLFRCPPIPGFNGYKIEYQAQENLPDPRLIRLSGNGNQDLGNDEAESGVEEQCVGIAVGYEDLVLITSEEGGTEQQSQAPLREPEIADFGLEILVEKYVLRLYVAMDDPVHTLMVKRRRRTGVVRNSPQLPTAATAWAQPQVAEEAAPPRLAGGSFMGRFSYRP
uniref:Uncharacterized protein n=1 Tax=Oryza punctata TaxID=4537 RepID=A0A0E0MKA2_ORYPU